MSTQTSAAVANLESRVRSASDTPDLLTLKKGLWAYFLLVIFEGALRKWFLPSLATPLLLVRDPIALWLLAMAWRRNLIPATPYLTGTALIGVVGIFTAVFLGHGSLFVALYGARILLIHFPLLFIIGYIFDRDDIVKIGKVLLWLALPMTLLIATQFYSPQSAWVNQGVGGTGGAGFDGALGYFRPPGTFAFTNGLTLFYGLLGPFILYFWLNPSSAHRLLLLAASGAFLAAIPLSISRSLLFQAGITVLFAVLAVLRKPKHLLQLLITIVGVAILLFILSSIPLFHSSSEAFLSRFDAAGEAEGGLKGTLGDRFFGGLVSSLLGASDQPFFGYGLGMGTNAGSALLTGKSGFLISEGEWGRLTGELGPLMGLAAIFIRIGLALKILIACYKKLAIGDLLPWLLISNGLLQIMQGQWAQPTSLGFGILSAGLVIASLRHIEKADFVIAKV
jgi:hypothetical protein